MIRLNARHRAGATVAWVSRHRWTVVYGAALVVVALVLALAISAILDLEDRADRGDTARDALAVQLESSRADAQALADQVEGLGEEPVVTPEAPDADPMPGPPGARGEQGPGPSPEQVAAAVSAYCAGGRCAAPPSGAQVSAAVVAYCSEGRCTGPAGAAGAAGGDGQDGTDGATGSSGPAGPTGPQGPAGPAPTADQIRAAVDAYCTTNGCTGPQGETGQTGRGIAALACASPPLTGTTAITVTYSDGTTETIDCT